MSEIFGSFFLGVFVTCVLGWSYIWNADGRCIARAEKARAEYKQAERLRNAELSSFQDGLVADNVSRQISRDARYNHVLNKLRDVTTRGCIIPEVLKEALIEAESIE